MDLPIMPFSWILPPTDKTDAELEGEKGALHRLRNPQFPDHYLVEILKAEQNRNLVLCLCGEDRRCFYPVRNLDAPEERVVPGSDRAGRLCVCPRLRGETAGDGGLLDLQVILQSGIVILNGRGGISSAVLQRKTQERAEILRSFFYSHWKFSFPAPASKWYLTIPRSILA